MPLYDFECGDCNTVFEKLIREEKDEQGIVCPSCGSKNVIKKFSSFGLKSGWDFTPPKHTKASTSTSSK